MGAPASERRADAAKSGDKPRTSARENVNAATPADAGFSKEVENNRRIRRKKNCQENK
jgi:hypothetical protein